MTHPDLENTSRILSDLIGFETISSDSNQAMIAYLAERLEDHGADIIIDESPCGNKANLFATLGDVNTPASCYPAIRMWCQWPIRTGAVIHLP